MTDLLAIESPQGDTSSLAYVGSSLIRALEANGHAPIAVPTRAFDPTTTPPAVLRAYARHRDLRRARRLIVDRSLRYGLHHHGDTIRARSRAALLYWDSDHMPASFAHHLATFDELFGVSTFVADVMRTATGRDVGVLHHGVWPDECPSAPPPDGPFRFLHLGQVDERKATDVLLRAFVAAFPAHEAVRLTIKCGPGQVEAARTLHQTHARGDDRVEVIGEHLGRRELSRYFLAAHAVVLPSRCEGFGLVGLEALAHGRTVIAHGFSGPLDYLDPMDCTILPSSGRVPAPLYPGFAREPDFDALVAALRAAAGDRDATCRRGAMARERVLPSWSWQRRVRRWADRGRLGAPSSFSLGHVASSAALAGAGSVGTASSSVEKAAAVAIPLIPPDPRGPIVVHLDRLPPSPADPERLGVDVLTGDPLPATTPFTTVEIDGLRLTTRPGTWDEGIAREVIEHDFYLLRLWQPLRPPRFIVDVGAHIGSFAAFAGRMFPEARLIAAEALAANALLAAINTSPFANVAVLHRAVWAEPRLLHLALADGPNSGGHRVAPTGGRDVVRAETLSTLLSRFDIDRIDFLKLDCEGAEWEIIPQVNRVGGVQADLVAMELHLDEASGRSLAAMQQLLQARFEVVHVRTTGAAQLLRVHAMGCRALDA